MIAFLCFSRSGQCGIRHRSLDSCVRHIHKLNKPFRDWFGLRMSAPWLSNPFDMDTFFHCVLELPTLQPESGRIGIANDKCEDLVRYFEMTKESLCTT